MIEFAAVAGHLSSFSQSVVILRLFSSHRMFFILTEDDHPSHLCRKAANGMHEAFVPHLSAATQARLCAQLKLCMLKLLRLLPRTLTRGWGGGIRL